MARILKSGILCVGFCFVMLPGAKAQTARGEAMPYPKADTPKPVDRGALTAQAKSEAISVTIALSLRNADEAESLLTSLSTPGNSQYHQFLSADEFAARFAPTPADVAAVVDGLAKYGLTSQRSSASTLTVTGSAAAMENAFGVTLHSYKVAAHGNAPAYTFHAPLGQTTIPSEISAKVSGVFGLDSQPRFHPHNRTIAHELAGLHQKLPSVGASSSTGNPPGLWTVQDFANYYNVNPLYKKGLSGKGRTLAIVTLASFTPSDAFAYWDALGLNVNPKRLQIVNVDGGPGAPSDASGSVETTIDVQQSGGIAPGAQIIVYQAPNTGQAFLDAFAAAIDCNTADSVSTSWGDWEWFYNLENNPVTDPRTGQTVGFSQALHELLVRAGIQGQTIFAAAGDGGAFDANHDLGCFPSTSPSCSIFLGVDYPASDTAITAGGGTTLAGQQDFCLNAACTPPYYVVNIPHERAWAWDYQIGLCKVLGYDPISCGIFPAGGGGGVSVQFKEPIYQYGVSGTQRSQPGQSFVYDGVLYYSLPPYYPGRNVPDVSFNADPDTGYVIFYTSNVAGFIQEGGWGGTSFVGPQLNGVTALLGQAVHGRLGLLNYSLYGAADSGHAYYGKNAPLNSIPYGDNWFYRGSYGYNPAVGLGTLDVANFEEYLTNQKY